MLFGVATAMFAACGDEPEKIESEGNATGNTKNGALIKGEFSIAQDRRVHFSQGNLQYQASTGTWRFAKNQYDFMGMDNVKMSEDYNGWIDLFGWGTSGYNGRYPYNWTSLGSLTCDDTTSSYCFCDTIRGCHLYDIANSNYDWGVFNSISNGGDKAGMWRTLSYDEWYYLLYKRAQSYHLFSQGTVNGIEGLIILPDDWELPSPVPFEPQCNDYQTNYYNPKGWEKMEEMGAVFLPAAGYYSYIPNILNNFHLTQLRENTEYGMGIYWCSNGDNLSFFGGYYNDINNNVCLNDVDGGNHSVRLVQDVK